MAMLNNQRVHLEMPPGHQTLPCWSCWISRGSGPLGLARDGEYTPCFVNVSWWYESSIRFHHDHGSFGMPAAELPWSPLRKDKGIPFPPGAPQIVTETSDLGRASPTWPTKNIKISRCLWDNSTWFNIRIATNPLWFRSTLRRWSTDTIPDRSVHSGDSMNATKKGELSGHNFLFNIDILAIRKYHGATNIQHLPRSHHNIDIR